MQAAIEQVMQSEAATAQAESSEQLPPDDDVFAKTPRRSVSPGDYWHCNTIPLSGKCWGGMKEALVMVDDFSRKVFVYIMENKQHPAVIEAM